MNTFVLFSFVLLATVCISLAEHQARALEIMKPRFFSKRCWICSGDDIQVTSAPDPVGKNWISRETEIEDNSGQEVYRGYNWGYHVDENRFHRERKNSDGIVEGEVGYVDAHGNNVGWNYKATPKDGYKVSNYRAGPGLPENYEQMAKDNFIFPHFDVSPLLKSAIEQERVKPAGYSGNQARFAINPVLSQSRSISELASEFGAIPVAAVHDGRQPPSRQNPRDQTSPLLIQHEEVPSQLGRNFYLLVPVRQ